MTSWHCIGMIKQDHLAGKLSARHHIPHLVAEPLRLLARCGVVVQPLLDHPVPGGGDYHHGDGGDNVDFDWGSLLCCRIFAFQLWLFPNI